MKKKLSSIVTDAAKVLALKEQTEAKKQFNEFNAMPNPEYTDEFKLNMEMLIEDSTTAKKTEKKQNGSFKTR